MPTLQIRMDEGTLAEVKRRGGSAWAREQIVEALREGPLELSTAPAPIPESPEPAPIEPSESTPPEVQLPVSHEGLCLRWMHHRKGTFCKVCGEVS
jgi:hypothetical protein